MIYEVQFNFSKQAPKMIQNIMIEEYNKLRSFAVDRLNPCYKQWNDEYTEEVHGEYDPKYNEYIASKQRPILEEVNSLNKTLFTRLDCDEYCDIIGVCKFDAELIMHVSLKPTEES